MWWAPLQPLKRRAMNKIDKTPAFMGLIFLGGFSIYSVQVGDKCNGGKESREGNGLGGCNDVWVGLGKLHGKRAISAKT